MEAARHADAAGGHVEEALLDRDRPRYGGGSERRGRAGLLVNLQFQAFAVAGRRLPALDDADRVVRRNLAGRTVRVVRGKSVAEHEEELAGVLDREAKVGATKPEIAERARRRSALRC